MKRGIYLVVIAIMLAATAMAQHKEQREMPTVEQIAKMKAERMRKQLLLGNEQYEKVYKSCLKEAEQQRKRMQQMAKEREEMAKEMKGILNEAQWERYEQMQKPRMHRRIMKRGWRHNQNCEMHCPMKMRRHKSSQGPYKGEFKGRNNHLEAAPDGVFRHNGRKRMPKAGIELQGEKNGLLDNRQNDEAKQLK